VDRDGAGGPLDFLPLPGHFIQALAAYLDGADHGWNLPDVTGKPVTDVLEVFQGQPGGYRPFIDHLAVQVMGDGRPPQLHGAFIGFVQPGQVLGKACRLAQAHDQQSGRPRVESAGMSDAPQTGHLAQHIHHVMRGHPLRLVNKKDSIKMHFVKRLP